MSRMKKGWGEFTFLYQSPNVTFKCSNPYLRFVPLCAWLTFNISVQMSHVMIWNIGNFFCISARLKNQLYVKVCLEFIRMTEEALRHFIIWIYEHVAEVRGCILFYFFSTLINIKVIPGARGSVTPSMEMWKKRTDLSISAWFLFFVCLNHIMDDYIKNVIHHQKASTPIFDFHDIPLLQKLRRGLNLQF